MWGTSCVNRHKEKEPHTARCRVQLLKCPQRGATLCVFSLAQGIHGEKHFGVRILCKIFAMACIIKAYTCVDSYCGEGYSYSKDSMEERKTYDRLKEVLFSTCARI